MFEARVEAVDGGKKSHAALAEAFKDEGCKMAKATDAITPNFIMMAQQIHDRLLPAQRVLEVLQEFEAAFGLDSCFNHLIKLHILATKPSSTKERIWLCDALCYQVLEAKTLDNFELSKNELGRTKLQTGLIPLLGFKMKLMEHWLDVELPKNGFDEQDRILIRRAVADHHAYKKYVSATGDVAWMGKMRRSSVEALRFIEDIRR